MFPYLFAYNYGEAIEILFPTNQKTGQSKFSGEERFHASPLICCGRLAIHRSKELVRPEAKLLRLVGEVARRAGGVSHTQK